MRDILTSLVAIIAGKAVYDATESDSDINTASVCVMAGSFYVLLSTIAEAILGKINDHLESDLPNGSIVKVLGQTTLITGAFLGAIYVAEEVKIPD